MLSISADAGFLSIENHKKLNYFSGFHLYLSSKNYTSECITTFDTETYITNVDELYDAVSRQHTAVQYNNFERDGSNHIQQDVLIIDIDNSDYTNENDFITIQNCLEHLRGIECLVFGSKSHRKWKLDCNGEVKNSDKKFHSPRDRFHCYLPIGNSISSIQLEEFKNKLEDYFYCSKINKSVIDVSTLNANQMIYPIHTDRETFDNSFQYQQGISIDEFLSSYELKNQKTETNKVCEELYDKGISIGVNHYKIDILKQLGIIHPNTFSNKSTISLSKTSKEGGRSYYLSLTNHFVWKNDGNFSEKYELKDWVKEHYGKPVLEEYKKRLSQKISEGRVSIQEGQRIVRKSVKTFLTNDENVSISMTEGGGKSSITREELIEYRKENPEQDIFIFCYSKKLMKEWSDDFIELGVNPNDLVSVLGRYYEKDKTGNCLNEDIEKEQKNSSLNGLGVNSSVCKKCPHFDKCDYQKSWETINDKTKKGRIFLFNHQYLHLLDTSSFQFENINLGRVVVDENFTMNLSQKEWNITHKNLKGFIKYLEDRTKRDLPNIKKLTVYDDDNAIRNEIDLFNVLNDIPISEIKEFRSLIGIIKKGYYSQKKYEIYGDLNKYILFADYLKYRKEFPYFRSLRMGVLRDEDSKEPIDWWYQLYRTKKLSKHLKGVPKLFLDSNFREMKNKILEDVIEEKVNPVSVDVKCHQNVLLIRKNVGIGKLEKKLEECSEKLIEVIKSRVEPDSNILIITNQKFKEDLTNYLQHTISNKFLIKNFGELRGRNDLQFDTTIIFGHNMSPAMVGYEHIFSLYNTPEKQMNIWKDEEQCRTFLEKLDRDGNIKHETSSHLPIHTKSGQTINLKQLGLLNEYANEIHQQILRDETTQAVLRNRSIYSSDKPKQVIIFSNELDNMEVDEVVSWENCSNKYSKNKKLNHILEEWDEKEILIFDRDVMNDKFGQSYYEKFGKELFPNTTEWNNRFLKNDIVKEELDTLVNIIKSPTHKVGRMDTDGKKRKGKNRDVFYISKLPLEESERQFRSVYSELQLEIPPPENVTLIQVDEDVDVKMVLTTISNYEFWEDKEIGFSKDILFDLLEDDIELENSS